MQKVLTPMHEIVADDAAVVSCNDTSTVVAMDLLTGFVQVYTMETFSEDDYVESCSLAMEGFVTAFMDLPVHELRMALYRLGHDMEAEPATFTDLLTEYYS
jgi:hypothetical protein